MHKHARAHMSACARKRAYGYIHVCVSRWACVCVCVTVLCMHVLTRVGGTVRAGRKLQYFCWKEKA